MVGTTDTGSIGSGLEAAGICAHPRVSVPACPACSVLLSSMVHAHTCSPGCRQQSPRSIGPGRSLPCRAEEEHKVRPPSTLGLGFQNLSTPFSFCLWGLGISSLVILAELTLKVCFSENFSFSVFMRKMGCLQKKEMLQ